MKNRRPIIITSLLASSLLLTGCTATTAQAPASTTPVSAAEPTTAGDPSAGGDLSPTAVMAENTDYTTVNLDEWDEGAAVDVTLSGSTATSDASGVSAGTTNGAATVTISEAGVYRLSGSLEGGIVVAAPEDALVVLILDGVDISNVAGAAIDVQSADDVAIHLADGSTNTVSEASTYADDADANAAIYSAPDLTISGSGSLKVTANGNDGITSKDDLVVLDGDITVTAADDALRGKDSLVIEGGSLSLTAGGDGLKSDGDEGDDDIDWTRGYIYVTGGTIDITAEDDGLQAFTDTIIAGGTVTASVVDDGVKAEVIVAIGEIADTEAPTVTVSASTEAIEAANIGLSGGTVRVTASDDGVNASGNTELQALMSGTEYVEGNEFADTGERLEISGGSITVDAEGDGLDSNGGLTITGGNTVAYGPTMGGNGSLDSDGTISVTGGTVVSFGPGSMEQTPGTEGQGWVLVSAQFEAGAAGKLVDESGATVAEFTSAKTATTVIVSSPDIEMGASYSVIVNGDTVGTAVAGEGGAGGMGMGGGPGGGGQPGGFGGQPGGEPGTPPEGFAPQG